MSHVLPEGCPWQSASVAHLPHWPFTEPERKQKGVLATVHASALAEPRSPLQGTQVDATASQTGLAPVQAAALAGVHCTQVLLVGLHAGVAPAHAASVVQATQVAWLGPVVAHIAERQTVGPDVALHGPSPSA